MTGNFTGHCEKFPCVPGSARADPLFGDVGGLGLLQIPPMDVGQVEVIRLIRLGAP